MKIKENNQKKHLSQQGITLIALVVTIIVLLILAAVTINAIFGENGLIKQIDIAKEKNAIAEYVDDLNRKLLEARINVANDESKILEETKRLVAEDEKYNEATIGEIEGDNKFTVITKEGYEIDVKKDGATYVDKVTETAKKVKLTVKHINKSGTELKATTETEYDKDTAVTVKSETISGYKTYSARITATEVNETLTEGAPVELSFGIYMDTEVVITYDVLQSGETEKEYEEKPTVSNSTEPVRVKPVAKDSSIKDSLPTDIKNSDNSYMVDIEPVKSNSGPLTITLDVSDKAEDGDTANVRHYKNSVWDNLGDFIVAQGKITFTIDSFSPFCITIKKKGSSTGGNTTGGNDNPSTTSKISTLVGTVVDKNTKAEDAYGNKITIPKGFKILEHNPTSSTGAVTYNYTNSEETGEHIPAVQDGIVIENGTDGNQFVWVPVGTINNKSGDSRGATSTITLGRYEFDSDTGALKSTTPAQVASVENCTQTVTIGGNFQELSTSRISSSSSENTTARNLSEFISTTLANGGYYIARFEASKNTTTNKIESQYNKTVLAEITQPNAAKAAREMYGEIKENNKLVYASDLVNSYAWDTAIVFIQTYSGKTDYASHNESKTTKAFTATGKNNDKYCNIWDMSGNASEWTTEYSTDSRGSYFYPCVPRGGYYGSVSGIAGGYTSLRNSYETTDHNSLYGLRPLLYVK
mgnify:CR=1 FL=1